MRVSEAEARERLGPVLLAVARAISVGDALLRDPKKLSPDLRARMTAGVLAPMRQRLIVFEARQIINEIDYPGTRWTVTGDVDWLLVGDLAACRFKQLDADLIPRNYPTDQAVSFADPELRLPGTPPEAAKFVAGWRVDPLGRAVQARYLVQPNCGDSPPWLISLDEIAAQGAPCRQVRAARSGFRPASSARSRQPNERSVTQRPDPGGAGSGERGPERELVANPAIVRLLRERAGLSQKKFAERIGLTQRKVSRIELGEVALRGSELQAVARALETPPGDFLLARPRLRLRFT